MMAAANIDLTVTGQVCKATPGHRKVKNGQRVKWTNHTGGDVIVFFPHDKIFGGSSVHFHHKIHDNHDYEPPKAVSGQTKGDLFPYAVYCAATNSFAEGGSNPEIIID
jgi:hypothetical protein